VDRRSFLAGLSLPLLVGWPAKERLPEGSLLPTPAQIEGPYYPPQGMRRRRFPTDLDHDLTRVGDATAQGTPVELRGTVRWVTAEPVGDALVEIWQTCHRGRYLHPADDWGSEIPSDPGFAYFGSATTDEAGVFAFRTVMPRRYPSGGQREWWRPPHVHVKVRHQGTELLTTQLYFDDPSDPDNDWRHRAVQEVDRVLAKIPRDRRADVIVPLAAAEPIVGPPPPWGALRTGQVALVVEPSWDQPRQDRPTRR